MIKAPAITEEALFKAMLVMKKWSKLSIKEKRRVIGKSGMLSQYKRRTMRNVR